MMIKITEKCSMGCIHCMNSATPSGKHMSLNTFNKAVEFQRKYGGSFCIITGGEPTEHPHFVEYVRYIMHELSCFTTVTTNGVWMQDNYDTMKLFQDNYPNLIFQVTNVKGYYPTEIDLSLPVFSLPNVCVCTELERIYPQGRALDNNLPWQAKGSKCFNIRSLAHQVSVKSLGVLIGMLAVKGYFCTPHIAIDGSLKVGESDLCPVCSHIDKTESEIVDDIINFRCNACSRLNKNLPPEYRKAIGEE